MTLLRLKKKKKDMNNGDGIVNVEITLATVLSIIDSSNLRQM